MIPSTLPRPVRNREGFRVRGERRGNGTRTIDVIRDGSSVRGRVISGYKVKGTLEMDGWMDG